jgi:2-oxo-4-hydroxy-4-carboxy-5-ureidoimidazoline decarboxylase
MTIAELNAYDRPEFVRTLGWIFEDSPWVAERAWDRRPFASLDELHGAMTRVVAGATEGEQLALLRAHPDLGTRGRVSDASTGEQRGAGLDRLTADEFVRLERLNTDYRTRFGFPFLYAVKDSTRHDVLDALAARGMRPRAEEFAEALQQVYKIARFRLEGVIGDLKPQT